MAQETQSADLVACLPPIGTFTLTPGNATGYDGPPVMLVLNLRGGNASEGALVQLWDECHNEHNHWRFASYGGNTDGSFAWQLRQFRGRATFVLENCATPHFPQCRWWAAPLWQ